MSTVNLTPNQIERLRKLAREEKEAVVQLGLASAEQKRTETRLSRAQAQHAQAYQTYEMRSAALHVASNEAVRAAGFDPDKQDVVLDVEAGVIIARSADTTAPQLVAVGAEKAAQR